MNITRILLAATLALGCTAALANGPESEAAPALVIHYSDAQLHSPDGARQVYHRIRLAADTLCAAHDGASLEQRQRRDTCRKATVDRAIAAFDAPLLTAVHAGEVRASIAWATR